MSRIKTVREFVEDKLSDMPKGKRYKALAHLNGVSLAAGIIAKKRGEDIECACIAGLLHDMYAYTSGTYDDHARLGAELAGKYLDKLKICTEKEKKMIMSAIRNHDDKQNVDSPFDEVLKDADVVHHTMADPSKPVKEKEQARYEALQKEFGF